MSPIEKLLDATDRTHKGINLTVSGVTLVSLITVLGFLYSFAGKQALAVERINRIEIMAKNASLQATTNTAIVMQHKQEIKHTHKALEEVKQGQLRLESLVTKILFEVKKSD